MYLKETVLGFIRSNQVAHNQPGRYVYSASCSQPTVYSSCYAAMTRALLDDLSELTSVEKEEWICYLQSFQQNDGLFCDPVIYNQGWFKDDPFDCGRPHLTCHVITALACLGSTANKTFALAQDFSDMDKLKTWLETRDWGERVAWTGNEVMNLGTLLQYARDFHNDTRAGSAVDYMLEWLSEHQINSATGLWGNVNISEPLWLSQAVQAAYHLWPLFEYDNVTIPYIERAIDSVLKTQNPFGGFGWGVHNPDNPYNSSACEDIDSIDPLARMYYRTQYRRTDIQTALAKAKQWVLQNQMADGGFVFIKEKPFEYGHPQLLGNEGQGAMFPTWFRTLSIAILDQVIAPRNNWKFIKCPGYQFWHKEQ